MALVGGYALLASSILISVDVLMRKFFVSPITGADELSGYALALLMSWAAAYALFCGSHIRVDVLYGLFPLKVRAWLDLAAIGVMLAFGLLLTWQAVDLVTSDILHHTVANTTLRTPLWIPRGLWVAGLAAFAVSSLIAFAEACVRIAQGDHAGSLEIIDPQSTDPIA